MEKAHDEKFNSSMDNLVALFALMSNHGEGQLKGAIVRRIGDNGTALANELYDAFEEASNISR